MATKRGVQHLDRLVLGGHAHDSKMADTYGQDELARPLRLLMSLIHEIRAGIFDPDEGRAAYLRGGCLDEPRLGGLDPLATNPSSAGRSWLQVNNESDDDGQLHGVETDHEAANENGLEGGETVDKEIDHSPAAASIGSAGEDDKAVGNEDSSSSSSSSAEDSSMSGEDSEPEKVLSIPQPAPGTNFLRRQRTRLLHMISSHNRRVLLCGRMVSDMYRPPDKIRYDSSVCRNCKKAVAEL